MIHVIRDHNVNDFFIYYRYLDSISAFLHIYIVCSIGLPEVPSVPEASLSLVLSPGIIPNRGDGRYRANPGRVLRQRGRA